MINSDDPKRWLRSELRSCLNRNIPSKSWPEEAIINHIAWRYVIRELCERLKHDSKQSPEAILYFFTQEVKEMADTVSETSESEFLRLYWVNCESVCEDIYYMYFDIE